MPGTVLNSHMPDLISYGNCLRGRYCRYCYHCSFHKKRNQGPEMTYKAQATCQGLMHTQAHLTPGPLGPSSVASYIILSTRVNPVGDRRCPPNAMLQFLFCYPSEELRQCLRSWRVLPYPQQSRLLEKRSAGNLYSLSQCLPVSLSHGFLTFGNIFWE